VRELSSDPGGLARGHYSQIDIIKGFAILGVLFTHASIAPLPSKPLMYFHSDQAVPVFILLMGMNLAMSMRRRAETGAASHYGRRLRRLAVPFAIVFVASSAIAVWRWMSVGVRPNFGPSTLLGYLPFGGAGNYFIFIIAAFTIAGPALWAAYRRWPRASVATMLAADLAFELAYGALAPSVPHFSAYGGNPVRLLAAFAIGLWLADGWELHARRNRWLLAFAAASLTYMLATQFGHPLPLFPGSWQPQNVLGFGYTAMLVMLGMRWLPAVESGAWAVLGELGRASYHIYLVQLLYFGFHDRFSLLPVAEDLFWPSLLGWLFYRTDRWVGLSGTRKAAAGIM
jgi:peptidoglycan/LPS O-acetylase OafA/YrhL